MKVTISNYSSLFLHGRNVIRATLYDSDGKPIAMDVLPNLLVQIKQQKHTLVNAVEVLEEVVMKFGAGA